MLLNLLRYANRYEVEHAVLSLSGTGRIASDMRALQTPVHELHIREPGRASRLIQAVGAIRRWRADVVHGWMYHGSLAAAMLRRIGFAAAPLVIGVRQSLPDIRYEKPLTQRVIRAVAHSARGAVRVVYNSEISRIDHERIGYPASISLVLPNGFDLERFCASSRLRHDLRQHLGVRPQDFLIGMVARFHPIKDHESLLIAFRDVAQRFRGAYCALVGAGCDASNAELVAKIAALNLKSRVLLLGEVDDVATIYPALDVHCLVSRAEGFPNVVGESMCCEVPNVATDVGCVREIIGQYGSLVPCGDTRAMAQAICRLLAMTEQDRASLGAACRQRILQRYDVRAVARQYERVFVAAAAGQTET